MTAADPVRAALQELVREVLRDELPRAVAALRNVQTQPGLVTVGEFAATRAITESFVRQAIRDHRLAATKVGRSVRIAHNAVIAPKRMRAATISSTRARAAQILGITAGGGR